MLQAGSRPCGQHTWEGSRLPRCPARPGWPETRYSRLLPEWRMAGLWTETLLRSPLNNARAGLKAFVRVGARVLAPAAGGARLCKSGGRIARRKRPRSGDSRHRSGRTGWDRAGLAGRQRLCGRSARSGPDAGPSKLAVFSIIVNEFPLVIGFPAAVTLDTHLLRLRGHACDTAFERSLRALRAPVIANARQAAGSRRGENASDDLGGLTAHSLRSGAWVGRGPERDSRSRDPSEPCGHPAGRVGASVIGVSWVTRL